MVTAWRFIPLSFLCGFVLLYAKIWSEQASKHANVKQPICGFGK
jgi:hypothetical protein